MIIDYEDKIKNKNKHINEFIKKNDNGASLPILEKEIAHFNKILLNPKLKSAIESKYETFKPSKIENLIQEIKSSKENATTYTINSYLNNPNVISIYNKRNSFINEKNEKGKLITNNYILQNNMRDKLILYNLNKLCDYNSLLFYSNNGDYSTDIIDLKSILKSIRYRVLMIKTVPTKDYLLKTYENIPHQSEIESIYCIEYFQISALQ